ncbi:hypothetical protein ACIQC9_06785 [Brevundimonas sp. NPDC092305]|uniref:hypothetical protein n=1 Tax=Brevundimonas sp. NPDC092305 TaxID=3363957 RepID=UPI0037F495A6
MSKTLLAAAVAATLFAPAVGFAQTATPIRIGESLTGRISASDPVLVDGIRHDCYRFATEKGRHARIIAQSSDLDAFLVIGQGESCVPFREGSGTDDDSAGGTDAAFNIYASGQRFTIAVLDYDKTAEGAYTLTVEADGPPSTGESLIVEELDWYANDYAAVGVYARRRDETRMSLRQGASEDWTVTVPAGGRYSVLGVCDENCRDFDLIVRGPDGEITRDDAFGDVARVGFGLEQGVAPQITITGVMASCARPTCRAGVAVFRVD